MDVLLAEVVVFPTWSPPRISRSYLSSSSKSKLLLITTSASFLMFYTICILPSHSWPKCECVYHKMFLDIMMEASKVYRPSSSYINDVLSLKTRHLLCNDFVDEKETADLMELRQDFKQHIQVFIQREKLNRTSVCTAFMNSVVCQEFVCACGTMCLQLAVCCTLSN